MLALEAADNDRRAQAHQQMIEQPNTITPAAELPPISRQIFRHRYQVDPEFRQHIDEHQ